MFERTPLGQALLIQAGASALARLAYLSSGSHSTTERFIFHALPALVYFWRYCSISFCNSPIVRLSKKLVEVAVSELAEVVAGVKRSTTGATYT